MIRPGRRPNLPAVGLGVTYLFRRDNCGCTLSRWLDHQITNCITRLWSPSTEQNDGLSQITQSVGELDKVTQQNAGNAEELSASAEETASHVVSLREQIGTFKINSVKSGLAKGVSKGVVSIAAPPSPKGADKPTQPAEPDGAAEQPDDQNTDNSDWESWDDIEVAKF